MKALLLTAAAAITIFCAFSVYSASTSAHNVNSAQQTTANSILDDALGK
jgi:hypothetical protein